MIYFLAVVSVSVLVTLLVRTRARRTQVLSRLSGLELETYQDESASILRKHTPTTAFSRFVVRLDSLFSRKDKSFLLGMLVVLPATSYVLLSMASVPWRISAGLLVVLALGTVLFSVRKKQQTDEFEQEIVQVLGLISRAVSAGLSVPQAITQVAESQNGLLGREFSRIEDQLALGHGMKETLNEACIRLPYKAFRYFTIALVLNQSNGGQLRDILHSLSRTLHDNRTIQKKVKSLTAEPRMAARFLSILPLIILAVVAWMNPSLFDLLFHTESGQSILIYCVCSIAFGAVSLQMMTKNRRFT